MERNRLGGDFRNDARTGRTGVGGAFGYNLPTGAGDLGYEFGAEELGYGPAPDAGAPYPGLAGEPANARVPGARQGREGRS